MSEARIGSAPRIALFGAVAAAILALVWFGQGATPPSDEEVISARWTSSVQCRDCHRDVWDEWLGSQHQIAYLNPEVRALSDDFRNKACQACHLPRPVAVTGYARRTLQRTTLPDEGVSCLTCHLGANGDVLARNARPDAPCAPRAEAELPGVPLCESCHNQHQTTDQWRATRFAQEGVGCNDCHMAEVARAGGRTGRFHGYPGSHDRAMLLGAIAAAAGVEGDEVVVAIENRGAGHNFPTEERSRAVDVMVRFDDGDWERAHRFRLPYRSEPLPDTTLPAGASHETRLAIPEGALRATVRVWYRRTPFVGDDDPRSMLLLEQALDLRSAPGAAIAERPRAPLAAADVTDPPRVKVEIRAPADTGAATRAAEPPLPPMSLRVVVPRFRALAAEAPAAPSEARAQELRELVEAAYGPESGAALATRARRALLEADDGILGLEAALWHPDAELQVRAAFELGRLGREASALPLLQRMQEESIVNPTSRLGVWLARALSDLGNHSVLPELALRMDDARTAEEAGEQAIEICRRNGIEPSESPTWDELRAGLTALHRAWRERGFVGDALPELDPATRARIAHHLANLEQFELRSVDDAKYALSRLGVLAVPFVIEAVHASEPYVRVHALEILRDLGPAARSAGEAVLPLLGDELSRTYAAEALGRIGYPAAAPHLTARLDHPDLELRAKVAEALCDIADPAAIRALRAVFADAAQPLDVRVYAAFALAKATGEAEPRDWLVQRRELGEYHVATLDELLARLPD
jgi:hypothetical protein